MKINTKHKYPLKTRFFSETLWVSDLNVFFFFFLLSLDCNIVIYWPSELIWGTLSCFYWCILIPLLSKNYLSFINHHTTAWIFNQQWCNWGSISLSFQPTVQITTELISTYAELLMPGIVIYGFTSMKMVQNSVEMLNVLTKWQFFVFHCECWFLGCCCSDLQLHLHLRHKHQTK